MSKNLAGAAILGIAILASSASGSQAAVYSPAVSPAAVPTMPDYVELADVIIRRAPRRVVVVRPYRTWVRRPHYGSIIAGVALGTIVAAAVVGAVPPPPRPDLCWYWADRAYRTGYWDYC
jgi:hypothetical protein